MGKLVIVGSDGKVSVKEAREEVSNTLHFSNSEGGWRGLMTGFGESYVSAFAVLLGATALQIGFLASFPQLLSSIIQLFAVKLTNLFESRKEIVTKFVFLQSIIWIFIIITTMITKSTVLLIFMVSLYFTFGALANPAWSSWIGDIVAEDKRGKFFGKRNRIMGMTTFVGLIIGGLILEYNNIFDANVSFYIIFLFSFVGGLVSYFYLKQHFEPIVEVRKPKEFGFLKFLSEINHNNFGLFTLFIALMHLSTFISAPYFVLYWLDTLGFSYMKYMILLAASSVAGFVTMTYWGANADHYGNKRIITVSSYLIAFLPFLWYFSIFMEGTMLFYFSLFLQALAGYAWGGFNLSSQNFIFDSVKIENRVRKISYFTALKGIAIFVGTLIGAILIKFNPQNSLYLKIIPLPFLFLLIISFLTRLGVTIYYTQKIKEVKIRRNQAKFLHFVTTMPVQGLIFDSIVGMNRTIKRFKEKLLNVEKKLDYWEEDYKHKTKSD